ncbi:radical SAM protein [Candidatus Woesearchaeota archaeon]|nr:MAG: radical SAM protein [Candidatus Woesearchaeota archaeon]
MGEGERALFELMSGVDTASVNGIAYKKNGKIITNPPNNRLSTVDLDAIDFTKIHYKNYERFAMHIPHSIPYSEMHFANIVGSRGCWNDCSFCPSKTIWGRRITYRTPKNVVDELEFLVTKHNVNYAFFADDDFLVNGAWDQSIATEIIRRGIHIRYYVMASVRSASRFSNYEALKTSGCAEITLGLETANQTILNNLGKNYEIQMITPVANEIVSHGIHLGLYYMMRYPEQTIEDLEEDYYFIENLPFSRIRPSFITPYPGTRLYQEVEQKGLWLDDCRNNWQVMTCDRPVLKTHVSIDDLLEAREKIIRLYLSENYHTRMCNLIGNDALSQKAFLEFQTYIRKNLTKN